MERRITGAILGKELRIGLISEPGTYNPSFSIAHFCAVLSASAAGTFTGSNPVPSKLILEIGVN
jgi:hypothetical protein